MKPKDRAHLQAVSSLLGIPDREANSTAGDKLDQHDWTKYLLAKDLYPDYDGPEWVPYSLWSTYEGRTSKVKALAKKFIYGAGAKALWEAIESTYSRPNDIPAQLVMECIQASEEWRLLSKRVPREHKKHMLRLKANALAIASEIDRMEALESVTTGERYDFMRLYSEADQTIVYQNVYIYNLRHRPRDSGQGLMEGMTLRDYMSPDDPSRPLSPLNHSQASREAGELWALLLGDDEDWPGIVPGLSPMMRRVAAMFDAKAKDPPLQRPSFGNAERNFFARHICIFFRNSFGLVSPSIVGHIVGIFFPQGITDNDVSQMVRKLPPMDADPLLNFPQNNSE